MAWRATSQHARHTRRGALTTLSSPREMPFLPHPPSSQPSTQFDSLDFDISFRHLSNLSPRKINRLGNGPVWHASCHLHVRKEMEDDEHARQAY